MIRKNTFTLIILFALLSTPACMAYEVDEVSTVTEVIDGDSFYIQGDEVRFADVSCPEWNEQGGPEATAALTELIEGKTVYLDTDQLSGRGPYGRLISVVYTVYNETHYLNVNMYMYLTGYAELTDYTNNEFNPYTWKLLERYAYAESQSQDIVEIDAYDELQASYVDLSEEYLILYQQYQTLNQSYSILQQEKQHLEQEITTLETQIQEVETQNIPGYPPTIILSSILIMIVLLKRRIS